MKKFIPVLILSILISVTVFAQSTGDYRSIGSGNWNDATKWARYNGSNWVSTTTYPGQNPGTGAVTIMIETEIKITGSVPNPVASLLIDIFYAHDDTKILYITIATLTFSSESAVSLKVSGDVVIFGEFRIENQNNAKSHMLTVGRSFEFGKAGVRDYPCSCNVDRAVFQTVNQDDKLGVTFNTTYPNSTISGNDIFGPAFQDVTFNGSGLIVSNRISISGTATFINGVVRPTGVPIVGEFLQDSYVPVINGGAIFFNNDATAIGASIASFVDGYVWKFGDDPFTFPIGDGGVYAPLTITAPVGDLQYLILGASYVRPGGGTSETISDPGLYSVSNCEYWTFDGYFDNTYPLAVTVGWTAASGCGSPSSYIPNAADITLAYFNGYTWSNHGGSGTGSAANGSVTWSDVTTSGPFTLGNVGTSCGPPSGLSSSNITKTSATVTWLAVPGAISYDVDYKGNSQGARTNVVTGGTSTSVNLVGLDPSIYDWEWRVRANCGSAYSSYRQAQFITGVYCGTSPSLGISDFTSHSVKLAWGAATNALSYDIDYKRATDISWLTAVTGTTALTYNLSGLIPSTEYNWRIKTNCAGNSGVYLYAGAFTTHPACIDVYEPNNISSQAKAINIGATIIAGIFSANDIDWYKLTPNNSKITYQVTLSNLAADYDLYVYDKTLRLVRSSQKIGISNEVVSIVSNGPKNTYYFKVVGKNGAYTTSLCYNLLAQTLSNKTIPLSSVPTNEISRDIYKQFLYPNPASEFVFLNFHSDTKGLVNLQIVNSIGQLVKQQPVNTIKGHNQFKIQVADFRPGMYILRIKKGDLNLTRKFVIAR